MNDLLGQKAPEAVKTEGPTWVRDAIFYEIFPDRFANGDQGNDPVGVAAWGSAPTREAYFGGDLRGITDRLDYLDELGITAIYLTPVFQAQTNHRYDTSDYFKVDPSLGTTEELRCLVGSAHSRGIRVVLDAVMNHCGNGFWAFKDVVLNGRASRYSDWFFVHSYPIRSDPPSYQTCGGAWNLPKLNLNNREVREHLLKAVAYWTEECDIDGWRLDVPWKAPYDFWQEFRDRVKGIKSDCYVVGEVWRDPAPWLRGDSCDGTMNYPLRDILLTYCVEKGMDAEDFEYDIRTLRVSAGSSAEYQMNMVGSHDTARMLTICSGDVKRAILGHTFVFTYIGAPAVYYGDEIGLEGGADPDCRRCMPWDEGAWNVEIGRACRLLIQARRSHRSLRTGSFTSLLTFNGVFSYLRQDEDDEVIVVLNPKGPQQDVRIPIGGLSLAAQQWRDLFTGRTYSSDGTRLCIEEVGSGAALVLCGLQPNNTVGCP